MNPNIQNLQMMQMMQNATNYFMNANSKNIFDPNKLDLQYKKTLINQTITNTKAGTYKNLIQYKSISFHYMPNFNPGIPTSVCETEVINEHSLDVAERYAEKGIIYTNNNNMNPVIMHVVGKGFTGLNLESNEDTRDDMIMLRTTFCNTSGHGSGTHYPFEETHCVYAKDVSIIRPSYPTSWIPFPQIFRTGIITTAPVKVEKMLKGDKMGSKDLINTCTTIETVFQTAIARGHPILILTPFGHNEDNNPIEDIIKVYNYCIYKYGHWFKKIIVAVPKFYPKSIYDAYSQGIINPANIVLEIENECEADEMRQNLMAKSATHGQLETQLVNNNEQFNLTPEQMQMVMNMMKMNQQNY